jgi:hypothetical protein
MIVFSTVWMETRVVLGKQSQRFSNVGMTRPGF